MVFASWFGMELFGCADHGARCKLTGLGHWMVYCVSEWRCFGCVFVMVLRMYEYDWYSRLWKHNVILRKFIHESSTLLETGLFNLSFFYFSIEKDWIYGILSTIINGF